MDRLRILPLFGRGFSAKSQIVTTQKLVNAYRDPATDPDKSDFSIYGRPGLTLYVTVTSGPIRGGIVLNLPIYGQYIFVVAGNKFWAIDPAGTIVDGGTITSTTGPVFFAWNGVQLMFVDGVAGWIFTPFSAPLAQIVDVDFPANPTTCTWMGGYFFVSILNSGKFQWSDINNGLSWTPTNFASAETMPDNLLRIEYDNGQLLLFGERTTEFWALSGDANTVRRVGGSGIEWGIVSSQTVAKFQTGLAFLAQNRLGEVQAGQINGYQFAPFSSGDPEINFALNNRARSILANGTAFSWFMDGHAFYQLNFSDASYTYDALTDTWAQTSSSSTFGARSYANIRLALSQQPYVCDYRNGAIYLIDKTVYADNGDPILTEVTTKHVFDSGNRLTIRELAVEIEAGDGLVTGQGSNPQIMGSWSWDGGRTYGNEVWNTAGMIGNYRKRAVWRNVGRGRDFAFKFRVSDPVFRVYPLATIAVAP